MTGRFKRLLCVLTAAGGCLLNASAQIKYVVKEGETIEDVSAKHNVSVEDIKTLNPDAANFFFAGMQLMIPEAGASSDVSAVGFGALPTMETMKDHYRRSSICLILMVHSDKPYAEDMVRVFQDFPMPVRYNEHNIDLRVVEVKGKQNREDIESILHRNNVGREVVGRWFNRCPDGRMNMDLVHERGGYGAFHDDYMRAINTVRGTATLRDEGIELLESTFVLVCDMEYMEQNKGFKVGAVLSAIGSVALGAMSAVNEFEAAKAESKGDYSKAASRHSAAQGYAAGSQLAATGAAVLNDLSKFRVNIHSYLYKLNWDPSRTSYVFNNYWVDESTPTAESERRRRSFDNASFGLEYVGDYSKASSKTKLVSCTDVDQVVLDVCSRSVEETVKALANKFVVFRPRTPFYCENGQIYSLIGTKEDVEAEKKYEIVKRSKGKDGKIEYKRVGTAKAGNPWQNTDISFDRYFDNNAKGTVFTLTKGNYKELAQTPGLQIREMN